MCVLHGLQARDSFVCVAETADEEAIYQTYHRKTKFTVLHNDTRIHTYMHMHARSHMMDGDTGSRSNVSMKEDKMTRKFTKHSLCSRVTFVGTHEESGDSCVVLHMLYDMCRKYAHSHVNTLVVVVTGVCRSSKGRRKLTHITGGVNFRWRLKNVYLRKNNFTNSSFSLSFIIHFTFIDKTLRGK